jgi:hypothetical protein
MFHFVCSDGGTMASVRAGSRMAAAAAGGSVTVYKALLVPSSILVQWQDLRRAAFV